MIKSLNRFLLLIAPFLIFVSSAYATHLVGGDFRVTMVNNGSSSSSYDIQLRLYRDDVNGAVGIPTQVTIGIYKVGTNALQTTKTLYQISSGIVPLGDPCYTPNPSQVRIEEGVFQSISSVTLPNYAFGYYLQYETCCRNGLIDNLATPTSDGISIFALIPDPGLGQNSSPDFGDYPLDAYFCVNNVKNFTWPVTDPDGDQLVYSLVAPLDQGIGFGTGNSGPGAGAYPFYPDCIFAGGYSITDMIGGTPPMSIDPNTGEITASPAIQGFFAFTVRVEEFRNGVKIGEVRRDAQYASLPCIISNPPVVSVNANQGNAITDSTSSIDIDVYVDSLICFDLEIGVNDPNDSIYILLNSNDIDLSATYVQPNNLSSGSSPPCNHAFNMIDSWGDGWNGASVNVLVNGVAVGTGVGNGFNTGTSSVFNFTANSGDVITLSNWVSGTFDNEVSWNITNGNGVVVANGVHGSIPSNVTASCPSTSTSLAYFDWENIIGDSVFFNSYNLSSSGYTGSKGNIYQRYCWEAPCEGIDSTFLISMDAYSVDCSGYNAVQSDIFVHVNSLPQATFIDVDSIITISYDSNMCVDLFAKDSLNPNDTLFIQTLSNLNFDVDSTYIVPTLDITSGLHYYEDFITEGNTIYMEDFNHSGNITYAKKEVALRFCWLTDCNYIFEDSLSIGYMASSSVCGSDSIYAYSTIVVNEPLNDGLDDYTPNIFTPNGDNKNDNYKLLGKNDPCSDVIQVSIYNRWGNLVFYSTKSNFEWNGNKWNGDKDTGKECDEGSYYVVIDGTYGKTFNSLLGDFEPNVIKEAVTIQLMR